MIMDTEKCERLNNFKRLIKNAEEENDHGKVCTLCAKFVDDSHYIKLFAEIEQEAVLHENNFDYDNSSLLNFRGTCYNIMKAKYPIINTLFSKELGIEEDNLFTKYPNEVLLNMPRYALIDDGFALEVLAHRINTFKLSLTSSKYCNTTYYLVGDTDTNAVNFKRIETGYGIEVKTLQAFPEGVTSENVKDFLKVTDMSVDEF